MDGLRASPFCSTASPIAAMGEAVAILLMAVIRVGWHLPLMVYGHIYWTDIALIVAAQVVFTGLYIGASRSVLPIMLLHLLNNTVSGEFVTPWFEGADSIRYFWLLTALWCGAAAISLLMGSHIVAPTSREQCAKNVLKIETTPCPPNE